MQSDDLPPNSPATVPVQGQSPSLKRRPWHAPVLKELDIALTSDARGGHPADGKSGNDKDHS